MKSALLGLVAILAGGAFAAPAEAQSSRSVTFDFLKLGTTPGPFACEVTGPGGPGNWVVTQAPAEGGIRRVLAQTSQVAVPERFPHCLLKGYRAADVEIVVLIRPVSGTRAQAGGIVWRAVDRQNYYAVLLDARADEMAIYKIERGRAAALPLAGEERKFARRVKLEHERWYELRLRATDRRFEVFLDNAKQFEVEDGTFLGAGAVGLVTAADSVVQFDAFNVTRAR
jgi:hypothetical protein